MTDSASVDPAPVAADPPPRRLPTVLVPVKAFSRAKERLSAVLAPADRAALAEYLATKVIAAAGAMPVMVVTDDPGVATWADRQGAQMLWRPAQGLNDAVAHGVARLATEGVERVIVAHADLPFATDLGLADGFDGVTVVPDRHGDGNNVLSVPTRAGFRFAYGPGSFHRHVDETERLGLALRVLDEPTLAWDVDTADDLTDDMLDRARALVAAKTQPQDS